MNIVIVLGILITLATGAPVLYQLLKSHPRGLMILFFAEMWERFSYYGMRGILIFYLTQHLLFDDKTANSQYGSYTSLVYLLPLIGGLLADRYLGTRKAVAFGALLLVAGHATMAFEGEPAVESLVYNGQSYTFAAEGRVSGREVRLMVDGKPFEFRQLKGGDIEVQGLPAGASLPAVVPAADFKITKTVDQMGKNAFYLAVSLIIMGVGFLKPNISTIVGQLYEQGDPRRDAGFTLYYYGINLGAFWSSVLCAYLAQRVGWWAGFGLAGVGMMAGWVAFMLGKRWLEGHGEPPDPELLKAPLIGPLSREWLIYLLGTLGVVPVWLLVQHNDLVGGALGVCTVLSVAYIFWFMAVKCEKVERERMLLALVLIGGSVVFFTFFEQAGTSLNLFADRNVNMDVTSKATTFLGLAVGTEEQLDAAGIKPAGWWSWIDTSISAAQSQSFNAAFILIFAPIFASLWAALGRRNLDPNPTLKFGLALIQLGLGFLVVVWGAGLADASFRVPLMMLGLLYLLHTLGELFLSPVGLSEITKLSVPVIVSFMMAVWFLASSIAQFLGGFIAGWAGTETVGGQVLDPKAALDTSLGVFQMLGWWGIGFGIFFIALSPIAKRWAHGVNDPANHPA